jgi:biopolymer transport protein TolQ
MDHTSEFSFWSLFTHADLVVQIVMAGLMLASVWCWSIVIDKSAAFARARKEADDFERVFWSGQSLDELYQSLTHKQPGAMGALFVAAMREWRRSIESTAKPMAGVQMRIERVMEVTITREMERLERRLLFLATVGSVSPFVGLFGTVWGIMNAFQRIAGAKNTSLSVVAPGIAEALFATALGLLAAIPAVIFYNNFSSAATRLSQRLEAFADEFSAIVSRQLDSKG